MKKSLAVVVAGAMAFSMFASAAFAADTTTELTAQQKFDALKAAGIVEGYPDQTAGLDREMTRAEFAKVLSKIEMLTENPGAASVYTDVPASHWARGFIGAVTEEGIMEGMGGGKFGPSGNVTIEQVAKVADELAGLEESDTAVSGAVSDWAKGYVAAAIEAGLIAELPTYKANATREMLVDVAYDLVAESGAVVTVKSTKVIDDKNIEVTFSDDKVVKKELDTALKPGEATKVSVEYNGKTFEVTVTLEALEATSAKQTGAKKITVSFNQAATKAQQDSMTFSLKSSLSTFSATPEFAEDGKSAVLTAAYLPVGDYTLKVNDGDDIKVSIVAEVPTKIDISAPALQKPTTTSSQQDVGIKLQNQFGEAMNQTLQISAYNITTPRTVAIDSSGKITLDNTKDKLGDSISVTAVYAQTGLSANKVIKIIDGSVATSVKFNDVQPPSGESRIAVSQTGLTLPLVLTDSTGQSVKLPAGTITFAENSNSAVWGGLYFYVSDPKLIQNLTVDGDGKITFNTGAELSTKGLPSETVYITVTNGANGASATTNFAVNAAAIIKELQLSLPSSIIVQDEPIAFPYTAVDTYGNAITKLTQAQLDNLNFVGLGLDADNQPKVNAKGELVFKFHNTGSSAIYTYVNNVPQTNNITVTVNPPSYYTAINGIKDTAKTLEVGAKVDFDKDNITIVDNYGRTSNVADNTYDVTSSNGNVKWVDNQLVAVTSGTATITVKSHDANKGNSVADNKNKEVSDYSFTVTVVKSDDIKTYEISSIATLFGAKNSDGTPSDAAVTHGGTVTLIGKTAGGTAVALAKKEPTYVTSTDTSVLTVAGNKVYGLKAGKSTLTAYFNNTNVASQEVTVSDEAPVVKTAAFKASEYQVSLTAATINNVKLEKDVTVALDVKDQYGVAIATDYKIFSSDPSVATVDGMKVTGVKVGTATLTYVAANGTTATSTIVVNP